MTDESTVFKPHGKHLIAGEWIGGGATFANAPATGHTDEFQIGTPAQVDAACAAAEEAFWSYGYSSRAVRATFLEAIADEIEARAEAITEIGSRESGLPVARLQGERGRTTGQLRLFATAFSATDLQIVALRRVQRRKTRIEAAFLRILAAEFGGPAL